MNQEVQNLINQVSSQFAEELDRSTDVLLSMGGCTKRENAKQIQVDLLNNGYDFVEYAFDNNPSKRLMALTDYKGKFIKGYLVELDFNTFKINRTLIKSKTQYEKIIKGEQ